MKQIKQSFNFLSENQPPQFSTPDTLHGILNLFLRVQIRAEDPEGQNITFTLLRNGTISLRISQISKEGFLDAYLADKHGTVFIQVDDDMGATNVLILHLNATKCPCEHNGTCHKNDTIFYPMQPSDYLCQCKEPYTGDLCEIRPNPCKEQPCYPGLQCTTAQNSEGFTCEDCPPSFKGDGKQCELDNTQGLYEAFVGLVHVPSTSVIEVSQVLQLFAGHIIMRKVLSVESAKHYTFLPVLQYLPGVI